jgi:hypothetical protein
MRLSIPYDVRAAFFGGIGAMISGLGGVLVSSKISVLSALGVGSTAALAVSAMALGPIALIVGLSAFTSLGVWSLVRTSWQKRLARKISRTLDDANLHYRLRAASDTYWQHARKSFTTGAENVKSNFNEYIDRLNALVIARDKTTIEDTIKRLELLKIFFSQITWQLPHSDVSVK